MKRFLCLMLFLFVGSVIAEEAVVVLRSTVKGNQEQPKVLYIVPWQQAEGAASLYRPLESLVSDVFQPLERAEFKRELKYRELLSEAREE